MRQVKFNEYVPFPSKIFVAFGDRSTIAFFFLLFRCAATNISTAIMSRSASSSGKPVNTQQGSGSCGRCSPEFSAMQDESISQVFELFSRAVWDISQFHAALTAFSDQRNALLENFRAVQLDSSGVPVGTPRGKCADELSTCSDEKPDVLRARLRELSMPSLEQQLPHVPGDSTYGPPSPIESDAQDDSDEGCRHRHLPAGPCLGVPQRELHATLTEPNPRQPLQRKLDGTQHKHFECLMKSISRSVLSGFVAGCAFVVTVAVLGRLQRFEPSARLCSLFDLRFFARFFW